MYIVILKYLNLCNFNSSYDLNLSVDISFSYFIYEEFSWNQSICTNIQDSYVAR